MSQPTAIQAKLDPAKIVELDLTSDALRQNMLRGVAQAWATREPFYVLDRGIVQVIICRYRDALEVLQDRERFTATVPSTSGTEYLDHFNGAQHVARMDGAPHDQVRKVMTPPFAPVALAHVESEIRQIFDRKLDAIESKGGIFDLMDDLCSDLIPEILLGVMLKMGTEQQKVMVRMNGAMKLVMETPPGGDHPPAFIEAYADARNVLFDMIALRRKTPTDDFIGRLVSERDSGSGVVPDDETIFANAVLIAVGGLGSTATSLGSGLMNLARHPDQYRLLREKPELIKSAIEECLRVHNPGFFTFPRFAVTDTNVGGTFIPKDATIHISAQAAGFDPEAYPDPLRFDVTRNPKNILSFGAGPHHCLGNRLARLVMKVGLEEILKRFSMISLADPNFEPRYTGMFSETAPVSIPMVAKR
jgi:cytochrome P450 RapN